MSDVCMPPWAFWAAVPFWIVGVLVFAFFLYVVIGVSRILWKGETW